MGQDGHMYFNFIPHHDSEETGQVWLGKVGPSYEIHQGHKELATAIDLQWQSLIEIVNWWIVCSASEYKRTHWWWYINGKRIPRRQFEKK